MIDKVLDWFGSWFEYFADLLKALVNTLFDMIREVFLWIVDSVLGLAMTLLSGVMGNPELSIAQYFTALPVETREVIARIGLAEALVVIAGAIVIRLLLQLIPFTRLGS